MKKSSGTQLCQRCKANLVPRVFSLARPAPKPGKDPGNEVDVKRDIPKFGTLAIYARVPQAMAQFVLKIENLSHINGANPKTRNDARLRSPSLIMAPGWETLERD